jgi:hypothetical protein
MEIRKPVSFHFVAKRRLRNKASCDSESNKGIPKGKQNNFSAGFQLETIVETRRQVWKK